MNMQKLMQEAQKMQRVITEKQEEIFKTNYEKLFFFDIIFKFLYFVTFTPADTGISHTPT